MNEHYPEVVRLAFNAQGFLRDAERIADGWQRDRVRLALRELDDLVHEGVEQVCLTLSRK